MSDISGAGAHVNITASSVGFVEVNKALETMQAQLAAVQTRLKSSVSSGVMAEKTYQGVAASLETASLAAQNYARSVGAGTIAQEGSAAAAAESVAALRGQAAALEAASLSSHKLAFGMKGVTAANRASRAEVAQWKTGMVGSIKAVEDQTGRLRKVTSGMQATSFSGMARNMSAVNTALQSTNRSGIATTGTINAIKTGQQALFSSSLTSWQAMNMKVTAFKSNLTSMFTTMSNGFKQSQWIGRQLMGISVGMMAVGAAAIYSFVKVNEAQTRLQKVTQATTEEIEAQIPAIRAISEEYGQMESITTSITADWAAKGYENIAGGDQRLTEVTDMVSRFALLGDIDLSNASDYVQSVLTVFSDGDMTKATETLEMFNAIENETSINTAELAEALPIAALSAKQFSMSGEELAGVLSSMKQAGVAPVEAAHAFKYSVSRLQNPTSDASKAMDLLGVSAFDSAHRMRDGTQVLAEMATAMENQGFTEEERAKAISDIFGARQTNRMLGALQQIRRGVQELADPTKTIANYTSDYARTMWTVAQGSDEAAKRAREQIADIQASPQFKFKQLKVQLAEAAADLGKFLIGPLLKVMDVFAKVAKWLNTLPNSVKAVIAGFLIFGAVLGPVIFATSLVGQGFATIGRFITKLIPGLHIMTTEEALLASQMEGVNVIIGQMDGLLMKLGETSVATSATQAEAVNPVIAATEAMQTAIEEANTQMIAAERAHVVSMESTAAAAAKTAAESAAAYEAFGAKQIASIEALTTAEILGVEERMAARRAEVLGATHVPVRGAGGRFARNPAQHTPIPLGPIGSGSATSGTTAIPLGPVGSTGGGIAGTVAANAASGAAGATDDALAALPAASGAFAGTVTAAGEAGEVASKGFFSRFAGGFKKLFSIGGIGSLLRGAWVGIAGLFAEGGAIGGSSFAAAFGSTGVGALILAVIAAVAFLVVGIIRNWDKVKEGFSGTFNFLKDQWAELMDALKPIGEQFSKVFSSFSSATSGEGGGGFWTFLGKAAGFIVDAFAVVIRVLAEFIRLLQWVGDTVGGFVPIIGIFFHFGDTISDIFKGLSEAIHGHWGMAMTYILRAAWWMLKPVLRVFEALYDGILETIQAILLTIRNFVSVMPRSILGVSTGVGELVDVLDRAGDSIQGWQDLDLTRNVESLMDRLPNDPAAHDAARGAGEEFGRTITEGVGDGVEEGGPGVAEDISKWMGDWLSAVKSRLDEAINKLKEQAKKAMEARFEANLKVYDDRIDAIDALTKAEEKALARKKYIESRRKLIEERAVQHANYMRDRALAIYEGRIDDARMMDLEEQKNKREGNASLRNLDDERRRTLVQEERDHQKEMLEIQKAALDERQKLMMEAFEAQLELITQYAPRTIGEFQSMLSSITNLLGEYGINTWPGLMNTGMGMFLDVIRNANNDVIQNAAWSGHAASTAWLAAFITGDAKAAILAGQEDAAAASSGGGGGGAGGAGYLPSGRFARNPDAGVGASHYNREDRAYHTGGYVGTGPPADVPATLQTGEYVIQRAAVNRLGLKALHQINNAHGMKREPETGDGLGDVATDGLKHYIRKLNRKWMTDDGTRIHGLRPGDIKSRFEGGGTVGGVTNAALSAYLNPMAGNLGSIEAFANWAVSLFPGLHISSLHRPGAITAHGGNTSLHALGRAVDIGGGAQGSDPNAPMNKLFAFMLDAATRHTIPIQELIHNNSIWSGSRGLHGWPYSDHFDHVHIGLLEGFQNAFSTVTNSPVVGGVADWIRQAMELTGVPDSWLQPLIARAMQESSGNPLAINNWDSNAAAGHPSKGLMQTIDSTFNAYALPGHGNIWNPVDNAAAAIRYIIARYGSVFNLPSGGYHTGGLVTPNGAVAMAMGGMVPFDNYPALLHKGEAVLPKPLTDKIQNTGECHHGGDTIVNINADTFVGDFEHFKKQMQKYEVDIVPQKKRIAGKSNRRIGGK